MATARRVSPRNQSARNRIRPAASETTVNAAISVSSSLSVFVIVLVVGDRRRRHLLTDAFTGLGHHIGDRQTRGLGTLLGLAHPAQRPGGGRHGGLPDR